MTDKEVRLMIKAPLANYEAIEKLIGSLHSYETPQIVAIPVVAGSQSYLDWIDAETIAHWLDELPSAANSGDVYARLA